MLLVYRPEGGGPISRTIPIRGARAAETAWLVWHLPYHFFLHRGITIPYFAVLFCKILFYMPHHISSPCATTGV